jgi:hypothetical protein
MTERTYALTVTEVPKSVNAGGGGSRSHHMAAHTEKKRWEGLYLQQLMIKRVPRGMIKCYASIEVAWRRRNHRDIENYRHPIVKPLADTLAPAKNSHGPRWLPDDTEEFFVVEGLTFVYPEKWWTPDPRSTGEMVITLRAVYP